MVAKKLTKLPFPSQTDAARPFSPLDPAFPEEEKGTEEKLDVQRFAQDLLKRNVTLLTDRFYQFPDEESVEDDLMELAPNPLDIRRVVKRNIDPEYDIPQIVDAVTEYLYNRIWMT